MNKKEVELTKYFDNMCIIFNTKKVMFSEWEKYFKKFKQNGIDAMHLKFVEDAAHDKILNEQYREEYQYKYQHEEKNKMYHDLSDDYKSRDYVIAITLKEGEYYGNLFILSFN